MGTYCETSLDNMELWSSKSYADELSLLIFQERDRRTSNYRDEDDDPADEDRLKVEYAVTAAAMRDRLDTLGFTVSRAREDFAQAHAEHIETHERWLSEGGYGLTLTSADKLEELRTQDFDWWSSTISSLVARGWNSSPWQREHWSSIPESEAIHEREGFFAHDLLSLRALLDALPESQEVVLDISALISSGYYDEQEPICANARLAWSKTSPVYGPTVILTEGKLDSRVLASAFEKIAPHLADYFGFLDFDGVSLPGSAENLAKLVRAFVGARLGSRVIAVFDNDTAGAEAIESLANLKLPPNIRVAMLPHCEVAVSYPTEGPQGTTVMDVNGRAASIEMYLGRAALTDEDGNLRPVRWSGYNAKMRRYQGAVEGKGAVQSAFFSALKNNNSPDQARAALPELSAVIDMLTFIFNRDAD